MEENKKNIIIAILLVIVVALITFVVLVLTNTISINLSSNDVQEINESDSNNDKQEEETFSKNVDDYIELVGDTLDGSAFKKISFKNLDSSLTESFLNEQSKLLEYIDSFEAYTLADGNMWAQFNGNILSIYYEIIVKDEIGEQSHIVVTNIDLKEKKVLNDKEVLALANGSFEQIALENYNELLPFVERCDKEENNCQILARDGGFITLKDYTENKDKYINNIINGLDEVIYCYIKDGIVKYDYMKVQLDNLFYINGKGGAFPYLTKEVGKYNY